MLNVQIPNRVDRRIAVLDEIILHRRMIRGQIQRHVGRIAPVIATIGACFGHWTPGIGQVLLNFLCTCQKFHPFLRLMQMVVMDDSWSGRQGRRRCHGRPWDIPILIQPPRPNVHRHHYIRRRRHGRGLSQGRYGL